MAVAQFKTPVLSKHKMVDLVVSDIYDGSTVVSVGRVQYDDEYTYDLLPSDKTGFYWANGILLGSTLSLK